MFSVDVPRGADGQPLVPADLWVTFPPAAQAVIVALAQRVLALEAEVRELRARLEQNSSNSSRPPSSDPPSAPRRAPSPSGRARGGQPGHVAHQRALVPAERVDRIIDHRPTQCGPCAAALPVTELGDDFVAHQVTEVPPLRAEVTEHRLHRVRCPACGAQTRATLPPDVPRGAFGPRLQASVAVLSGRYRLATA